MYGYSVRLRLRLRLQLHLRLRSPPDEVHGGAPSVQRGDELLHPVRQPRGVGWAASEWVRVGVGVGLGLWLGLELGVGLGLWIG